MSEIAYEKIRLNMIREGHGDETYQDFVKLISILPRGLKPFILQQLENDLSGVIIKMYLLGKTLGNVNETVQKLINEWKVSPETLRKHSKELKNHGLIS
jgi:hypothetical protein